MPKKTRKEKIIAQLRKKLETTKAKDQTWDQYPTSQVTHPTSDLSSSASNVSISYIVKDLRKTFFLAGLAISLEFVVYWLTELGGNRLFKFLPIFR